jgi:flagellar biosynthesis protein FlhA
MLDYLKTDYPVVVEELIPNLMSIGEVQKIFAQLLKEGIPLRNLVTILETLADYAPMTKDLNLLGDYVRVALKRQISKMLAGEDGKIQVLTISAQAEERIIQAQEPEGEPLTPTWLNRFYASLNQQIRPIIQEGRNPVMLVAPAIRRYVRSITERVSPKIFIISYQEIIPEVEVHSLGMVGAEE